MRLVPLGDTVIVQPEEDVDQSPGGIALPESVRQNPQTGKVLSVGDGRRLDNGERHGLAVKEGDKVLFASHAGEQFQVAEDTLLVMTESDILAVLE